MSKYIPTIGLEIHAELKTQTKMFCNCKNDADETRPNVNVCPVCLAHPGTLPVINKEAVRHVLRVGAALGGTLADYTEFDRKNYFYPDLPKGYQISQYEYPLVSGGSLGGVAITRVHLEEDTASSMHDEAGTTTIDFNRSGVPLMELVTEPVMHSAAEAGSFARELQLLLRYLGVSDANMEKGEVRVEANVSVSQKPKTKNQDLGTKVEIKNLNSFRAMERAVEHEIRRQAQLLERGENVAQETRGWDEGKQKTFAQRTKEGSADYRYFPDPDLPSLRFSELPEFSAAEIARDMPELPSERRERYRDLGVSAEDAELFVREPLLGRYFDSVSSENFSGDQQAIKLASNYIANDLVKILRDTEGRDSDYQSEIPISGKHFAEIVRMVSKGELSSRGAKDVLAISIRDGGEPKDVAISGGLMQVSDEASLSDAVDVVIAEHIRAVEDLRAGKKGSIEFLLGQVMRSLKGAGNPSKIREMLQSRVLRE